MPGYHVTVAFMPYRFSPGAISPQFRAMIAERARQRGEAEPETIHGSLMIASTPTQQLEDYEVWVRETDWRVPWHEDGKVVEWVGSIGGASRLFPMPFPPPGHRWWSLRDVAVLTRELSGYYGMSCKVHYYFCNYHGGVATPETYTSMCAWRRTKFSAAEHLEV